MEKQKNEKKMQKNSPGQRVLGLMVFLVLLGTSIFAEGPLVGENEILRPKPTSTPPTIDGVLDDAAWSDTPIVKAPFIVNNPVYGEIQKQKTEIWLTYDQTNLYFAFYCYQDNPEQIKGTISKRDSILEEDWVGVDLDSLGNRQTTYEHYCNPLGIQADLLNSVSGGESSDPDWVWYSAGKITKDGYIIEMRLPLKSLKYKSGKEVTMNLAFYRKVTQNGTNASWPQINQSKGYFNSLVPVVFEHLPGQLRLEALPAITFSSIRDRQSPQNWEKADKSWQAGLDIKYGITSASNIELSINPDFSQVETDQFQILANQRYPIFYSEKRPFFMEIANQFSLAAAGSGNMSSAVHTRNIVDPSWGTKFTGEFNKFSLGLLAAGDEWPGLAWENYENPHLNKNANFFIGRAKYLLKGDAFIGLLYSGREFAEEYNRTIAADTHFRFKGKHNFSFNTIYTFSQDLDTKRQYDGGAFTLNYNYNQKPLDINVVIEDYSKNFHMDSAFYQRTGITAINSYIIPRFYPKWNGTPWIKRVSLLLMGNYLHDKFTDQNDSTVATELRLDTPMQGNIELTVTHGKEFWAGQTFTLTRLGFFASIQPYKWLNTHINFSTGDGIFYNSVNPFLGKKTDFHSCLILQLGNKLMQHFSFTHQNFRRESDNSKVYTLNILVSRTTFQFNKYLFIRALVQLDTYTKKIVTDLLASFTLIPGTVMHIGYGSMHDKLGWVNGYWQRDIPGSQYEPTRQSFFCKVGYRWQF